MKSKKMITVMATIVSCLFFLGAILAQGFESHASDDTSAVETTVSSNQLYMNANLGVMGTQATQKTLEELEDAYYYQMIEDQYSKFNDNQLKVTSPLEDQSTQDKKNASCSC